MSSILNLSHFAVGRRRKGAIYLNPMEHMANHCKIRIERTVNKRSQCSVPRFRGSDDLSFCLSRKVARLGTVATVGNVGNVGTVARQRATSIDFGTGQCIGGLCSWWPHGVGAWI